MIGVYDAACTRRRNNEHACQFVAHVLMSKAADIYPSKARQGSHGLGWRAVLPKFRFMYATASSTTPFCRVFYDTATVHTTFSHQYTAAGCKTITVQCNITIDEIVLTIPTSTSVPCSAFLIGGSKSPEPEVSSSKRSSAPVINEDAK